MDYKLIHQTVSLNQTVFDNSVEQSIDCDLTLPDYCPVIQRILKCNVTPQINSYQMVGDRLTIDGFTLIRLFYTDENNKAVRCYEYQTPYSKSVEIKAPAENACIGVCADMQYVNCRAVSQRRVDIHGSFSLKIKISVCCDENIITDVEGGGMELKRKNASVSSVAGEAQRQFIVNEVLEIGSAKPSVQQIIRCSATAILRDFKIITNKLLLKGELVVKTLYCADSLDSGLETAENSIPISQIIDMEGIDDTAVCDIRLSVLSFELQTKTDASGETRLLDANAKINVSIKAMKMVDIAMITDAYSTQCELISETKAMDMERLVETFRDTTLCRKTIDVGYLSSVLDVWCDSVSPTAAQEENALWVRGTAVVCMLAISSDGSPVYIERTLDFEYKRELKISGEKISCQPFVTALASDYTLNGADRLDIRLELSIDAGVFISQSVRMISELSLDETRAKPQNTAALTIYFADAGEQVWEIARSYNTTVHAIVEENELKEETIREKCMLLIPCV